MEQDVKESSEITRRESSRDFSAVVTAVSFMILFTAFGGFALYKILSRLVQ